MFSGTTPFEHESYLVEVRPGPRAKPRLYWRADIGPVVVNGKRVPLRLSEVELKQVEAQLSRFMVP